MKKETARMVIYLKKFAKISIFCIYILKNTTTILFLHRKPKVHEI